MSMRTIHANGAELSTQTFGSPGDPCLLMIMGACASMLWWPAELCQRLAQGGRFVIRYDQRDTGQSTTYPPGQPGYSLIDLAEDAIGILDAYSVAGAHIVGMSLGGMIGQILALTHPDRVLSLTLVSSSVFAAPNPDLPTTDPKILDYHRAAATLNWGDKDAVMDYMVSGWRLLSGSRRPFNEADIRAIGQQEAARAINPMSMFNHALLKGGEDLYGKTGQIAAPTLILHGTDDPVLPYPHAQALARLIPGARLVTLEGAGHEIHRFDWDTMTAEILRHSALA